MRLVLNEISERIEDFYWNHESGVLVIIMSEEDVRELDRWSEGICQCFPKWEESHLGSRKLDSPRITHILDRRTGRKHEIVYLPDGRATITLISMPSADVPSLEKTGKSVFHALDNVPISP